MSQQTPSRLAFAGLLAILLVASAVDGITSGELSAETVHAARAAAVEARDDVREGGLSFRDGVRAGAHAFRDGVREGAHCFRDSVRQAVLEVRDSVRSDLAHLRGRRMTERRTTTH